MFDNQLTYLKSSSKQLSTRDWQTTSIQAPILGKKIRLADKSDNHVIYHHTVKKEG